MSADEVDLPVVEMLRPRWGDPETVTHLPDAAHALIGASDAPPAVFDVDAVRLPGSVLSDAARAGLVAVVGDEHVVDSAAARAQHTRGYSTTDLLRMRAGDLDDAPDAVVYPGSHDEVVALLEVCTEHRVAVVPFTGGTSVVGGLAPARAGFAGVVSVDLRRLDQLIALDEVSRTATLAAGLRGVRAEELLRERGYTLGHFPQSYEGAGIGGYAATRSAGQSSAGYGRFDEMVEGLVLATPRGTVELGTAPKSAAGPDLRQLVLGSEGVLGVITSVVVRIRPRPRHRIFEGYRFPDFDAGAAALRALAQDGPMPTVLRLSDELETAINLADPGALGGGDGGDNDDGDDQVPGCLAIVGFEGGEADVEFRRRAVDDVLTGLGGQGVGTGPGESWREGRFRAPYLRDALLDAGVLVETLETVTFWSGLPRLRTAVTDALTETLTGLGAPPLVMCHISHVYPSGASLYFTVVVPQTGHPSSDDLITQWAAAKTAANDAIGACGASITHHHAVGRDHRDAYHAEIGESALEALRAMKNSLDPAGICNPGILL